MINAQPLHPPRGRPEKENVFVLLQGCFPGNLLLCHSSRNPKIFWSQHSQNLIGGTDPLVK